VTSDVAIGLVFVRAIVLVAPDAAHHSLGVMLSPWQQSCAHTVVVAAPIAAVVVIRSARSATK
jgi:hypothetical protein